VAASTAIYYPVSCSSSLAMMRLEGKEAGQKHYHPEVVLLTNSKIKCLCWLLHATVVQGVLVRCHFKQIPLKGKFPPTKNNANKG
jgi:hypothetical protein